MRTVVADEAVDTALPGGHLEFGLDDATGDCKRLGGTPDPDPQLRGRNPELTTGSGG